AGMLGLLPAVASAGGRFDCDRGFRQHGGSSFGISIGFGNSWGCGDYGYTRFSYSRGYYPAYRSCEPVYRSCEPVYRSCEPVYCPPRVIYSAPPVVYVPSPPVVVAPPPVVLWSP